MSTQAHAQGPRSTSLTLTLVLKSCPLCAPVPMGESQLEPLPWLPNVTSRWWTWKLCWENKLQNVCWVSFFNSWNVISKLKRCYCCFTNLLVSGHNCMNSLSQKLRRRKRIALPKAFIFLLSDNVFCYYYRGTNTTQPETTLSHQKVPVPVSILATHQTVPSSFSWK